MAEGKFIAYYRVSTARQGQSGLGLEAQKAAVTTYLNGGNWTLLSEFTEVESGKRSDRPKLREALEACRKQGATLVIAKIDRLSRNLAFLANLMESKTRFVACDDPTSSELTIHIKAAIAQHEAKQISERTKAALKAAKARGKKLGWANSNRADTARASAAGVAASKARADQFADNIIPVVQQIRAAGVESLKGIAEALNARGLKTARGGQWYASTVQNVLKRGS